MFPEPLKVSDIATWSMLDIKEDPKDTPETEIVSCLASKDRISC